MTVSLFHLAIPVTDLDSTRIFYTKVIGCHVGRESERWIDFDFFGHQVTTHLVDEQEGFSAKNMVDGKHITVRHFGVILEWNTWHQFIDQLRASGAQFVVEPGIRFAGQVGEQATAFIVDPSGNELEFKSFRQMKSVFAT